MGGVVRNVRRRVSFNVPRDDDSELVEETGVHAPLNVVVGEDSSSDEAPNAPAKEEKLESGRDESSDSSEGSDSGDEVAASGAEDSTAKKPRPPKSKSPKPAPSSSAEKSAREVSGSEAESGSDAESSGEAESSSEAESDSESESGSDAESGSGAEPGGKAKAGKDVAERDESTSSDAEDDDGKQKKSQPSLTFAEMDLDKRVSWAVAKLGWRRPTPVQASAVPAALAGRDVLVAAPTGSGKTAAYAIPLANQFCAAESARGHTRAEGTSALVLVPTRELATQVSSQLRRLLKYVQGARVATLTASSAKGSAKEGEKTKEDGPGNSSFARTADVLVGTPAAIVALRKQHGDDVLSKVSFVVVDEADLVLGFGHGADARSALAAVPSNAQAMLVSATLDAEGLPELRKVVLRQPLTVKVTASPGDESLAPDSAGGASHYFARLSSFLDRYLVTYAMLRLNVISGKVLIFTNGINSAFKLKLFLDHFKVKSAVLNAELPANSRVHCVEQFNAGIFDILIATDEIQRDDSSARRAGKKRGRGSNGGTENTDDKMEPEKRRSVNESKRDSEFGVSRGVDFRGVAAVINFDTPPSAVFYTHRAGRTARAGASGTILSLVVDDEEQSSVVNMGKSSGMHVGPLAFRMDQIEAFRYRVEDSLRAVTDAAIRQARLTEVRREMINSDRLKDYFDDNPLDLDALKHDLALAKHVPEHLAHVPAYLLPPALRETVSANVITRPRTRRRLRSAKGGQGKTSDPLKTFSAKRKPGGNTSRDRYKARHGAKGGIGKGNNRKKFGGKGKYHA